MFIRSHDGILVNLDHFSTVLLVPRNNGTVEVLAKAPHGDFINLAVGLSIDEAVEYMKTLERLLNARDVTLTAAEAMHA